jgi:hypothetical protein
MTEFMVYQGNYFELGAEYAGVVFFIYNLVTSFPVLYYILVRPYVWSEPINKKSNPKKQLHYISEKKVCA